MATIAANVREILENQRAQSALWAQTSVALLDDNAQLRTALEAQASKVAALETEIAGVRAVVDAIKADIEVVENQPVEFQMQYK